jgi:hypothetical protein
MVSERELELAVLDVLEPEATMGLTGSSSSESCNTECSATDSFRNPTTNPAAPKPSKAGTPLETKVNMAKIPSFNRMLRHNSWSSKSVYHCYRPE